MIYHAYIAACIISAPATPISYAIYVGNKFLKGILAKPNLAAASSKYGTAFSIAFSIAKSPGANAGASFASPANAVPPTTPNLAAILDSLLKYCGLCATVSSAIFAAN